MSGSQRWAPRRSRRRSFVHRRPNGWSTCSDERRLPARRGRGRRRCPPDASPPAMSSKAPTLSASTRCVARAHSAPLVQIVGCLADQLQLARYGLHVERPRGPQLRTTTPRQAGAWRRARPRRGCQSCRWTGSSASRRSSRAAGSGRRCAARSPGTRPPPRPATTSLRAALCTTLATRRWLILARGHAITRQVGRVVSVVRDHRRSQGAVPQPHKIADDSTRPARDSILAA